MGKRGKAGKPLWVIAEWLEEVDPAEFWLTMIAAAGWILLIALLWQ